MYFYKFITPPIDVELKSFTCSLKINWLNIENLKGSTNSLFGVNSQFVLKGGVLEDKTMPLT